MLWETMSKSLLESKQIISVGHFLSIDAFNTIIEDY